MMSRYGTFATCRFMLLIKPAMMKSELPAAVATLSVPGLARASATKSASDPTGKDSGTESAITMTVTFTIGSRSRSAS